MLLIQENRKEKDGFLMATSNPTKPSGMPGAPSTKQTTKSTRSNSHLKVCLTTCTRDCHHNWTRSTGTSARTKPANIQLCLSLIVQDYTNCSYPLIISFLHLQNLFLKIHLYFSQPSTS